MRLKIGIFAIFLAIGLLGVPNCTFAQENSVSTSESVIYNNLPVIMDSCSLNPEVKGGGGGGGGGKGGGSSSSSKSSSSSTKKTKSGDGDDDNDNSTSSSSGGMSWITIALLIIFIPLGIILLLWFILKRRK